MVGLPLHEGLFDTDGLYYEREIPTAGNIRVSLSLGYLMSTFRRTSDDPWGEFVRAQKITAPHRIRIRVAAH
jgi:hypothetical protein